MTPKARAEKVAQIMWAQDNASPWFGMELISIDEGTASLSLTVLPEHTNGHGNCHGGITFALADSAFAFASNSRNQYAVAQHNSITYLAPARLGDVLTATAREVSVSGRSGIYDVAITRDDGTKIAEFRGGSRIVRGQFFEE